MTLDVGKLSYPRIAQAGLSVLTPLLGLLMWYESGYGPKPAVIVLNENYWLNL